MTMLRPLMSANVRKHRPQIGALEIERDRMAGEALLRARTGVTAALRMLLLRHLRERPCASDASAPCPGDARRTRGRAPLPSLRASTAHRSDRATPRIRPAIRERWYERLDVFLEENREFLLALFRRNHAIGRGPEQIDDDARRRHDSRRVT